MNQDSMKIIEILESISQNGIKIINNFWHDFSIEGIGAFLGALFAFIVSMLTLELERSRKRFIIHKNAVVQLEYILNDHLNDIATNQVLFSNNIAILKRGHLTYNRFSPLDFPKELELKLADLDVINQYVTYRESVRRINADLNKINLGLDSMNNYAVITGRIPSENFEHFIQQMKILEKYLSRILLGETKKLLAFTRIYLRRINSYKGIKIYKLNHYKKISKQEIKSELKVMQSEINETMDESSELTKKFLENDET